MDSLLKKLEQIRIRSLIHNVDKNKIHFYRLKYLEMENARAMPWRHNLCQSSDLAWIRLSPLVQWSQIQCNTSERCNPKTNNRQSRRRRFWSQLRNTSFQISVIFRTIRKQITQCYSSTKVQSPRRLSHTRVRLRQDILRIRWIHYI